MAFTKTNNITNNYAEKRIHILLNMIEATLCSVKFKLPDSEANCTNATDQAIGNVLWVTHGTT